MAWKQKLGDMFKGSWFRFTTVGGRKYKILRIVGRKCYYQEVMHVSRFMDNGRVFSTDANTPVERIYPPENYMSYMRRGGRRG